MIKTTLIILSILLCSSISHVYARTTLTASDLECLGAFRTPREWGSPLREAVYGEGLALRRVNGEVRLFSVAYIGAEGEYSLYEITVPSLKTSGEWNAGTLVKDWGKVFTHRSGLINGLYWDETDKRLYYQTSGGYVGDGDTDLPTLAFLTFNQDESAATSYGKWGFDGRGFKKANFGLTAIPSDFSAQYLNGKRLAAGFGGYQSVMTHGDVSMGPALTAFDPPSVGTEGDKVSNTPLVGYGHADYLWTSGARPTYDRAWRDDDVLPDLYGALSDPDGSTEGTGAWNLSGDESFYWQGYSTTGSSRTSIPDYITFDNSRIGTKHWEPGNAFWNNDYLRQAGAWIQTTNKEGIVFLPTFSTGHNWYGRLDNVAIHDSYSEGLKHKWYIYSREQMASVVQGASQDSIQATRYNTNLSDYGITTRAVEGLPRWMCTGMAFDNTDNKLYVMIQYGSNAPTESSTSTNLIIVYQVIDNPAFSGKTSSGTGKTVSGPEHTGKFVQ